MTPARTNQLSAAIVLIVGVLWGFYWIPVRNLSEQGLLGGWSTVAITLSATLLLAPFALRSQALRNADKIALISIALGGAAFTMYSIGFTYGRVAMVILLFYLTPVWSTLLCRYILGWDTPRLRIVAMAFGIAGLLVILGADGDLPIPRNIGEWMGLASGVCWAIGSTGIRVRPELPPVQAGFIFALGGLVAALAISLPLGEDAPLSDTPVTFMLILSAIFTGGLWWVFSIPLLMWATARLEPARVGMLLMSEVIVGIISAAVIAGEHISAAEIFGGAFVICAGILEVWPSKSKRA